LPSYATTAARSPAAGSSAAPGAPPASDGTARQLGPDGIGQTLNWAWSWPANRRVLYNRASCDPAGKPYNPNRKLIGWNGSAWEAPTCRTSRATRIHPAAWTLHHEPEGVARFFARGAMAEGPFPEHYEPFETPLDTTRDPKQPQATSNPRRAGLSG